MKGPLRHTNPLIACSKLAEDEVDDYRRRKARLGVRVGNRHAETLFEGHYQFNSVESHRLRGSNHSNAKLADDEEHANGV
jgi:hypothetical protein